MPSTYIKIRTLCLTTRGHLRIMPADSLNSSEIIPEAYVAAGLRNPLRVKETGSWIFYITLPASDSEGKAYFKSLDGGYWKPMRRTPEGAWVPNRHQRKHGCLSLPQGKEVC